MHTGAKRTRSKTSSLLYRVTIARDGATCVSLCVPVEGPMATEGDRKGAPYEGAPLRGQSRPVASELVEMATALVGHRSGSKTSSGTTTSHELQRSAR